MFKFVLIENINVNIKEAIKEIQICLKQLKKEDKELLKYRDFFSNFRKMCFLEKWSDYTEDLLLSIPECNGDFYGGIEEFISYSLKFKYSEEQRFFELNEQLKEFSLLLIKVFHEFREHSKYLPKKNIYRGIRFYKDEKSERDYNNALKKFSTWIEELEDGVMKLTAKLNKISEMAEKHLKIELLENNQRFSYKVSLIDGFSKKEILAIEKD
ncbi:MAG: hypothetical protein ACRDDH_01975 [Cetobacterium sp.]|uniref:hypothetical protein n=1 Tax=Cetobacterium sp. TaxID=2071632 RepID=UPI003EE53162